MRRFIALALLASVAGCVAPPAAPPPAPPPPPAPAPAPTPTPPPLAGDWKDWPASPGTWVYRQDARGSIALFGRPGADAELTLRCDRGAHAIYLSRLGGGAPGSPMIVRTTALTRQLATQATGGTPDYAAAGLVPADPLLDAMGFSRGRFVVEQGGAPTLVVPAWAEILRVAEDCRQ